MFAVWLHNSDTSFSAFFNSKNVSNFKSSYLRDIMSWRFFPEFSNSALYEYTMSTEFVIHYFLNPKLCNNLVGKFGCSNFTPRLEENGRGCSEVNSLYRLGFCARLKTFPLPSLPAAISQWGIKVLLISGLLC